MRSLIWLLICGCAAHNAEAPPPREPPAEQSDESAAPPAAEPPPAQARPSGVIARAELVLVLDKSPGAFLQHVDVSPRFSGGRFAGWRLGRFFPGDDRFSGVDVQAGDVVVRVNGRSVEKPEQLLEVWQALHSAPALELELERNGAPKTLRWPIEP